MLPLEELLIELYKDLPDNYNRLPIEELSPLYRKHCGLVFEFVETNFSNHDLESNNKLLEVFDPYKCYYPVAMSLLRSTSRAKHLLSNWISLRNKTLDFYTDIKLENKDRLMVGLIDK